MQKLHEVKLIGKKGMSATLIGAFHVAMFEGVPVRLPLVDHFKVDDQMGKMLAILLSVEEGEEEVHEYMIKQDSQNTLWAYPVDRWGRPLGCGKVRIEISDQEEKISGKLGYTPYPFTA